MPADFEKCVREGGRVRTKKLNDLEYIHICFGKDGKSHAGEVKKKKHKDDPTEPPKGKPEKKLYNWKDKKKPKRK